MKITIRRPDLKFYAGYGPACSVHVTAAAVERSFNTVLGDRVKHHPGWSQVVAHRKCDATSPLDRLGPTCPLDVMNVSGELYLLSTAYTIDQWPDVYGVTVTYK